MPPITLTTTVGPDGTLTLDHLPFQPGTRVEVVVTARTDDPMEGGEFPLRGKQPYQYDDPFGSAFDIPESHHG